MKAIIDEQLDEVLEKLGIWEDFCKGNLICSKCKRTIDVNNLGLFIPHKGKEGSKVFDFYCNDPDCINEILNV